MNEMTPAKLKKEIMAIVGKEVFNVVGKMTDKQWRQWEDFQGLHKEKYCEKENFS